MKKITSLKPFSLIFSLACCFLFINCEEELPRYDIEITHGDGGVVDQSSGSYEAGTQLVVEAIADQDHVFVNWTGGIVSTDNPITIDVCEDDNIQANFKEKERELIIEITGEGEVLQEVVSGGKSEAGTAKSTETEYNSGSVVKLTAVPNDGWQFDRWTGDIGSSELSIEVTMNEAKTISALFTRVDYPLEINTVGQGSVTEEILANKTTDYESGTVVKLTAVAEEEWVFSGWSGDASGTNPEIQVTVDQAKSITATFVKKQYELTINTVGQGTVTETVISSKTDSYDSGTLIKLTAVSEEGWVFSGWSGDITSTDSEIQISVDEAKTITATFVEKEYELTINTVGQGTVNEQIVEDNTRGLSAGTTVRLTAIPDTEWVFSGWSGDITSTDPEIEITIDEAKTVTATFVKKQYELTVNIIGQGSVSEQIVSVTDAGTIVNLTADPGTEWVFSGWSGDASGTNPEIQVTVDRAKSITATFVRRQYELTVNIVGQGSVSEQIVSESDSGTIVKLTATADEDWVFTGWTGDYGGPETEIEISVNEPKTLTATFVKKQYTLEVNINGQGTVTEAIVSSKSTDYDTGTIVKLTAIPEEGWEFTGWTGDFTGTDPEIQLTVDEAKSVTATFERKNQSLEVIIIGDGSVNQKASGTSVTLEATPAEDWIFQGWSGDVTSQDATITFTLDDVEEITATFVKKQFTLEVNTVGEGTVTEEVVASKSTDYDIDSKIKLTAVPQENWKFKEWTGDVTGTNPEVEITLDAAKSVTATFEKIEFDLEVNTVGQGSVTETKKSSKTTTYESGDVIVLKAVPETNWAFTGWSGDATGTDTEIEITMDKAKSVTATFEKIQFTLEVTVVGNGSVTETKKSSKSATYDSGDVITLEAVADAQNDFLSWSGDANGTSTIFDITIDGNKSVTATFAAQEPVYLDDNGVTIKARSWATIGQSSVINGKTYTIISQSDLQNKIANNEDVTTSCTTRVTDMAGFFQQKTSFNQDISSWDLTNVTNLGNTFRDATSFNQDISKWNTANVTEMGNMFLRASSFSGDISDWDVSNVKYFDNMFQEANSFNAPIGKWTTTNLIETYQMFFKNTSFNQSLSNWNVSKVGVMTGMFQKATAFNGDLSGWNTENVSDMTDLFLDAEKFNQDISQWNVSKVTTMSNMFEGAVEFNQDLGSWKVLNVTSMSQMFKDATKFNQDIGQWNVSNVTTMAGMFQGDNSVSNPRVTTFNQNISNWNVSKVTDMNSMFSGNKSINQDLSGWNVDAVTTSGKANFDAYTSPSAGGSWVLPKPNFN